MHEYLKQTIEKFKIKFQGDNKITAMFLYGSVGRDANDEYSDVDLGVVIKDGFYNEVRNNIKGWLHSKSWNITDLLISKGEGNYELDAFVKLASGTGTGQVLLKITDGNGTRYTDAFCTNINSSYWSSLGNVMNIQWTGTLTEAVFIVNTPGLTTDFYVDDVSIVKQ
jgi:hypothetical protein